MTRLEEPLNPTSERFVDMYQVVGTRRSLLVDPMVTNVGAICKRPWPPTTEVQKDSIFNRAWNRVEIVETLATWSVGATVRIIADTVLPSRELGNVAGHRSCRCFALQLLPAWKGHVGGYR